MSIANGGRPRAVPMPPHDNNRPNLLALIGVPLLVVAALLVALSVFTINEMEQVIITQFGKPVGRTIAEPGIHFKIPFIQKANYIEKRVLPWDGRPNQIPTRDKKYIRVDTTARWRITDPLKYLQSVGTESSAQGRLDDIIDSATRDIVSNSILVELVRNSNRLIEEARTASASPELEEVGAAEIGGAKIERIRVGRNELQERIAERAAELTPQYGIALVDVKVKRINYEASVQKKVFDRMISERLKIAERIRSIGQGKRAEIQGTTEKELRKIRSEAYRQAEAIKGKADAEATRIYADAYGKAQDFYPFLKSLETYKSTLENDSILILSTGNEYLRFLNKSR